MMEDLVLDMSNAGIVTLPSLIPEQQAIIDCKDENIGVIASPATGKSRVLESKVYSLLNAGYNPKDILVFSYTNTAEDVLNTRLAGKLGLGILKAYTIHGHGLKDSKEGKKVFLETKDFESLIRDRKSGERLYEWVLCDEGQDLTKEQYSAFISWGKRHFLVGDPWQSMFEYAGADPRLLNRFCVDFKISPFSLKSNHRSASKIVEASNRFSHRDCEWGGNNSKGFVEIDSDYPEDLENLTVLARTNRDLEGFAEYLNDQNIPYTLVSSKNSKGRKAMNYDGKGTGVSVKGVKDYNSTILETIHCAKGDEWDRVLILHTREPWGSMDQEEKIFYVALTRARKELYITINTMTEFVRRLAYD